MLYTESTQQAGVSAEQPGKRLRDLLRRGFEINWPLMMVGIGMVALFIATTLGLIFDSRVITGAPAWLKPTKFAISVGIYSFTFVWLLSFVKGHKRLVSFVAGATAVGFLVEMVIIIAQVVRGTTSHFNYSSAFDATLFSAMGFVIVMIWVMGLIVAGLLLFQRLPDAAFAWSLRLGIVIALVGMGVAFFMTSPTAQQLSAMEAGQAVTIMGAHSVGVADGGPGLPLVGWSTTGGDLRIPHFFGLHGMQVLPLIGWALTRRRFNGLGRGHRTALVLIAGVSYLGLVGLLTWQALRGELIVATGEVTLQALAILFAATALAVIGTLAHARLRGGVEVETKAFRTPS